MDKIILDFNGDKMEIPSGFAYERIISQIGMKVAHQGETWEVVERLVVGVDEVAEAFSSWKEGDEPLIEQLTLLVILQKID